MRLIGKTAFSALLLFLASALCSTRAWADVVDRCDSADGPGSYQNLSPADQDYIRWNDPPDSSYLCQQDNRRIASALYRCSGAVEATVAIYSRYGCYAGYDGGELVRGGDQLPLRYQPSTGEVYCDGRRMVYDAGLREFVFAEEESRPSGLTEYGLSVYCSADGNEYVQAPVRLVSASREGPGTYWYEVYRAELTEGTRYLRLVLTDQSSIEILDREERYQFGITGGLSLASVEIVEEGNGSASQGTNQESERYDDGSRDSDEDWESWEDWEEDISGTGGLPAYQPGEEEGAGTLLWGPEEEPEDGEPAFPDETEEEEQEEQNLEKAASGGGSSASGGSAASSKSQSQKKTTASGGQEAPADEDIPEAVLGSAETVQAPLPVRREVPLWRRVTEPDAMTMVIIALTLLAMGIRILWENAAGGQARTEERIELARRKARYARYTSYHRDIRYPPQSSLQPPRDRQPERGLGEPKEDWDDLDDL